VTRLEPPLPAIGSAGFRFTDPTFGSRMLRVTDPNVRPDRANFSYGTPPGAESNPFNLNSTKFYVVDQGGNVIPYNFDPVNMTISRMGNTSNASGGLILPLRASPSFSYTDQDLIFGFAQGTNIFSEYRFSTGVTTQLHDPLTCLPSITRFAHDISITADGQRLAGYLDGTSLNNQLIAYVFDRTLGCRWLNTQTGQVGGQWGPTGTINIPDRFKMHNARISRDGQFFRLVTAGCFTTCSATDYVWDINTLTVTPCPVNAMRCPGHKVMGFTKMINQSAVGDGYQWSIRPLNNLNNRTELIAPVLTPTFFAIDDHPSWNNVQPNDSQPVCLANYFTSAGTLITRAWDREIICVRTDGVQTQVWRFAHHRSNASVFQTFPKGNVSPDGRFYMFNSDWAATLGPGRWDTFIVELK
jgi:hypothetical protein